MNTVWRTQHILNYALLRTIQVRVLIGNGDCLLPGKNRLDLVLSLVNGLPEVLYQCDS